MFATSARTARPTPRAPRELAAAAVIGSSSKVQLFSRVEAEALGCCGPVRSVDTSSAADVMKEIRNVPLVHFSCHGSASRTDAVASAVHLADGGVLTAGDILRATLPGEPLVFLASCETASPDPMLPDQTFGPPAAFLHAGAGAVIAPLLAVSVPSSALVAARFYFELAPGTAPHVALNRAQRWLAGSTAADRQEFLTQLIGDLRAAGRPTTVLERLTRCLGQVHDGTPRMAAFSLWSLFTLNV